MSDSSIVIRGAREHNLRGIDVEIPRDRLTVITGLSGSGKSSLAFDTIYAEGQRRYVESLSSYARQFLGQMDKPDLDSIDGLSPAVSIDQKTTSKNPRSTVGTVTEIYDYLRLLFARIGTPHCPECSAASSSARRPTRSPTRSEAGQGRRAFVLAPVVVGRKGEFTKLFEDLRGEGFSRVRVDGEVRGLDETVDLDKKFKHTIEVVVDRIVVRDTGLGRIAEAVEQATRLAHGNVSVYLLPDRDAPEGAQGDLLELFPRAGLPRARALHRRPPAARLLLQRPLRSMPGMRRPGLQEGRRRRDPHRGPEPLDRRGRLRLLLRQIQLLPADLPAPCARIWASSPRRPGRTSPPACARSSWTASATRRCASTTAPRTGGTPTGSPSTPACATSCTSATSRRRTRTPRPGSSATYARSPARAATAPACDPRCSRSPWAASPSTTSAA